jgi:hypothetical protein
MLLFLFLRTARIRPVVILRHLPRYCEAHASLQGRTVVLLLFLIDKALQCIASDIVSLNCQ